ncbi:hypothetical protein [Clostridium sp. VAP41]|uniref:hypothetical protein n=1 Tax=Clostridium sp. VAP41 TaxID=2949979 RepID=UPI0020793C0B|nr:hypothetical protein [Clostridium sp. VAP41]
MENLMLYIFKKYGLRLSEEEINELLEWYKENADILVDEETADIKVEEYLYKKYKGRVIHAFEEDLSSLKDVLSLLKAKSNGR